MDGKLSNEKDAIGKSVVSYFGLLRAYQSL